MNNDLAFILILIIGTILLLLIFIGILLQSRPKKRQIAFCSKCGDIIFGKMVDDNTKLPCEKCKVAMEFLEIPEYLYFNIVAFFRKIRWLYLPLFIALPIALLNFWVLLAYGSIYLITFLIILMKMYITLKHEIQKWIKEKT